MIEVPMLETLASFWLTEHLFGATWTPERGTMGYDRIINKFRHPFPTKDGYICALPYTDAHWLTFFEIVEPARPRQGPALRRPQRAAQAFQRALPGARFAAGASHRPRNGWRPSTRPTSRPCRCARSRSCSTIRISRRPASSPSASIRPRGRSRPLPARSISRRPRSSSAATRRASASDGEEVLREAGRERRGDRQAEGRQGADRAGVMARDGIAAPTFRGTTSGPYPARRQSRAAADRRTADHAADRRGDRQRAPQRLADRRLLLPTTSVFRTGAAAVRRARPGGRARRRRAAAVLAAQSGDSAQSSHVRRLGRASRAAREARLALQDPVGSGGRPRSASIRRAG